MGSCCKDTACQAEGHDEQSASSTACPRCGAVGRPVGDETIQAVLKPGFAASLAASERRFCRTSSCDVLYYGPDGRFVEKSAATVRVGLKEAEDPVPLCYCFNFSFADVQREVAETGGSTIPGRITAEIQAGRCACEVKNPSGACCLGDVHKAVKDAQEALDRAPRHVS